MVLLLGILSPKNKTKNYQKRKKKKILMDQKRFKEICNAIRWQMNRGLAQKSAATFLLFWTSCQK